MSNQNIDWEKGNIQEPNQINWDKGEISPPLSETKAKKGFLGQAKDLGVSALKGAIAVPESVVGIMDTMSYGAVGKTLENKDGAIGFRPNEAKQALSNLHTDQYKAQQQQFSDAGKDGNWVDKVVDKTKVALKNPSLIANSVVESVPSILASGAMGRATGIANPVVAGAVGEGLSMAGSQAEQIRQNTVDGNLTANQSLASVGTGALGSLFSLAGGRVAQKLGIGDANTLLASGRAGATDVASEIASMPAKSVPRKIIEGALHEGLLEELPQSVSEQILQNLALSKPWSDGIEDAAVMGTLAGMAMGAAAGPMHGGHSNHSDSVEQGNSGQTQNSDIPQLGMRDQAIDGEYIPRQDMPSQNNPQREAYTYDQQSTDAENLLGNNNNNSNFGAPDSFADTNPSNTPPNGPNTPPAPNGTYLNAPQKPSEQMGINPNDGPMSSAAALAVDSGASPALQTGFTQELQTQDQATTPLGNVVPNDYRELMGTQNNEKPFATGFTDAAVQQGNAQTDDRGKSLPQQHDTNTANTMVGSTETSAATTAPTKIAEPILGSDGQNKWFGSQEKAQAFIDKKKLGNDYQITQADKSRFEITPKQNESATPATVKPIFSSNQAVGSVGYAQDVAKQAVQQYQGDKSTLEDPKASLTGKGSATDLIYYKNSPSFSDVQVGPDASGDKAIVKLTSAKTGRVEQREYPSSLIDFNNFLEGTNNNVSKSTQDNLQNSKTAISATSESQAALGDAHQSMDQAASQTVYDPQDQISALENQLSNEKNVIQKAKLRKQINELKANVSASTANNLDVSAHAAATSPENNLPEPTQAQKEAGNYKKGHVQFHGLDISIENPRGSDRTGQRPDGTEWRHTMTDHYGYIKKTMGADGDHVDSYIGPDLESQHVYIVDQIDQKTGKFDEHKVMLGFNDQDTATKAYQANFDKNWNVGHIRAMTMNGFKQWLKEGDTTKPSAEFDDKTETVTTAAGRDLQVRPKVVEASDLIASNTSAGAVNEAYPQELQPRDRTRLASLHQINSIANDLKPNLLGKSPSASNGAPIVSSDNIIESGNGRTLAITQAYAQGKAEHYRNWLKSEGHDITGMKHPVLVRERMTPMSMQDRMAFTKEANTSNTLSLSATEQAQSDAAKLDDAILSQYQGGDLTLSKNLGFVRQFMSQIIGHTEVGNMILDDGSLSQNGVRRIQGALLYKAYSDESLLHEILENTDSDIKAIGNALLDVSGDWALMREQSENGTISRRIDVTPNLVEAVHLVRHARVTDTHISEVIEQGDIFEGEIDPVTQDFIRLFFRGENYNRASGRDSVASALKYYVNLATETKAGENIFGEPELTGQELIRGVNEKLSNQEKSKQQQNLLTSERANDSNAGENSTTGEGQTPSQPDARSPTQSKIIENQKLSEDKNNKPSQKLKEVIQDFGEKIEGAKKDIGIGISTETSADDIAQQPLSKVWDKDTYKKDDNKVRAALNFVMRSELPSKPRVSYKVKSWVNKVIAARDAVSKFGNLSLDELSTIADSNKILSSSFHKVMLLQDVPIEQWSRVGKVSEYPYAYQYDKDGHKITIPQSNIEIDGKTLRFTTGSILDAVTKAEILEKLGSEQPKVKVKTKLEARDFYIYRRKVDGSRFITRKADKEKRPLKEFLSDTPITEVRQYIHNNLEILSQAWEDIKAQDNVGKGDIRNHENSGRTGKDWRKGRDASNQDFMDAFGFRGVQFGNWVHQQERQQSLNETYDALHDLAEILNIPTKAISLNGELGLAFGARGSGRAMAHYEPNQVVINLTKTQGAGSLAHEWFHALDHYFSRQRGESKSVSREDHYITYKPEAMYRHKTQVSLGLTYAELQRKHKQNPKSGYFNPENWQKDPNHPQGVRPVVEKAFANLVETLNGSPMKKRASALDNRAEKGYWSSIIEMGARSFENYVISKMALNGMSNDYLANVKNWEAWKRDGKNEDRYPYLKPDEESPIIEAFDNLFSTIEYQQDEKGNIKLYSREASNQRRTATTTNQVRAKLVEKYGEKLISDLERQGKLEILETYDQQGIEGFYQNGKVTLIADALTDESIIPTFLHELGGHGGFQNMMNQEQYANLMKQFDEMVRRGHPAFTEAKRLAERESDPETQKLEYLPYLLSLASHMQIRNAIQKGALKSFIGNLISNVKAWLFDRLGMNINLNQDDMVALAERMINKSANHTDQQNISFSEKDKSPVFTDAFSITESEQQRIAKEIDRLAESIQSYPQPVQMKMPPVLLALNAVREGLNIQNLPLELDKQTLRKIMGRVDGKQDSAHQLTREQAKQLFGEITNPVMVLESDTAGGLVIVTNLQDTDGKPFISAIHLDKRKGKYHFNEIASVYSKNNFVTWIKNQDEKGNVIYFNQKKSLTGLTLPPLQLRGVVDRKASDQSVLTADDVVNFFEKSKAENDKLYSRNFDINESLNKLSESIKNASVKSIQQRMGYTFKDWLGIGLQALGRRQLTEIYHKILPQLTKYNNLAAQMDADKNDAGAEADTLVREWAKLSDEQALAELMHDSTLAQIDPAKLHQNGDNYLKYVALRQRFEGLTPEAQKIYTDARDAYSKQHRNIRDAIRERILRASMGNQRKAELLQQMDADFFHKLKGVYFPLARFGKYVVIVRNAKDQVESVSRAETMAEAQALREELINKYPNSKVDKVVLNKDYNASRDMVGRGFMSNLYNELDNLGISASEKAQLEDTLAQLYLASLPDLSWAKHGIHRKGTAGFSQDARRAFAQNMFHGAGYLAKLRYSDLLDEQLSDMQKYADEQAKDNPEYDQPTAQRVINEMNMRHENLMNPKSNPLSSTLTSVGFLYYLGLSPASAVVNLLQTPLVTLPVMAAKWNLKKSSQALIKASEEAVKAKNDMSKVLTGDELQAYNEAVSRGVIDVTQAHDLAGIAQGEDSGVMWKLRPIMRWASFLFHHAERFNRSATFMASYRLAKESGASHAEAFDQAADVTYQSHFDYSSGNRPRLMQGNVAKVVFLFKQFGQNMVYLLTRQAYQAIKAENPEDRMQARKTLAGLLMTHALALGVLGLPLVGMLLAGASMIGGSDDEPWDAEVALRNMLADMFGDTVSNMIAKGVSRATPWDISGRVGLSSLILPDVQEGLEGQRWAESAMAGALGPVAGIGTGILKGMNNISDGNFERGLEDMLPVALKSPLKSMRYQMEGAQDKTGISILDEVGTMAIVGQTLGFSPSDVRTASEGKSAIYQMNQRLQARRSQLLAQFSRAKMNDDEETLSEVWADIENFNAKNPSRRITKPNAMQSYRNRMRRINHSENGVYIPKKHHEILDEGRFAFDN